MPARPRAVVFDVNETLFSLELLQRRMQEAGLPENSLQVSAGQLPCAIKLATSAAPSNLCANFGTLKAGAVQVWFARVLRDGVCCQSQSTLRPSRRWAHTTCGRC